MLTAISLKPAENDEKIERKWETATIRSTERIQAGSPHEDDTIEQILHLKLARPGCDAPM